MITATLRITASDSNAVDIVRLLRSLIEPTLVEKGCIGCRLYRDVNEPDSVTWMEQWSTREDLKSHLRSPQYKKILAVLDMSDVEPEIHFDTVVETAGMQLIEEARGANA